MNIHEQITALLDGELNDETQVAELLHVLAVAPEKRRLLMEQVRMGRSFGTLGAGIAPSRKADAAIWAAIGSVDSAMPVPPPPPAAPTASPAFWQRPGLAAVTGILLIGLGTAIGSMFGGKNVPSSASVVVKRDTVMISRQPGETRMAGASRGEVALLRDSLADARSRYATLSATNGRLLSEVSRLKSGSRLAASSAPVTRAPERPLTAAADLAPSLAAPSQSVPQIGMVSPRSISAAIPTATVPTQAPVARLSSNTLIDPIDTLRASEDRREWMMGMRTNFRLSLPRIYGVPGQTNALTDRELVTSHRLEAGTFGLRAPLRFGVAVGGTQVAEVLHTNTGGALLDTIIEQTPTLLYGRAFVSSQIIGAENWGTAVEFGGGGTMIGPFATLGLDMEYRALDRVSLNLGLSSWFLWTQFRGQTITSTNLNAHVGGALWF